MCIILIGRNAEKLRGRGKSEAELRGVWADGRPETNEDGGLLVRQCSPKQAAADNMCCDVLDVMRISSTKGGMTLGKSSFLGKSRAWEGCADWGGGQLLSRQAKYPCFNQRRLRTFGANGVFQSIGHPPVQAFAGGGGFHCYALMQFRGKPHVEAPGIGLLRRFAPAGAERKIIFHGLGQSGFQFVNGTALKGNDVRKVHNFAVKDIGVRVIVKDPW